MAVMRGFSSSSTITDVVRERSNDMQVVGDLQKNKLQGRIRTDTRAVPTTALDVNDTDGEGDVVVSASYIYLLLKVSGVLKWHRVSLSVGW